MLGTEAADKSRKWRKGATMGRGNRMNSKLIYLDTNIWNRLIDQDVSPQKLLGDLASKDANLALSGQTIYELSRTFLSSVPNALVRARDLLRYLKHYVDAEIPCAHDNMEQLHGEISATPVNQCYRDVSTTEGRL